MTREQVLLGAALREETRILELGPSFAPIAAKADGWRTFVVDHLDRAGLRAKYADAGVTLERIEAVDGIWQDGQLHEAVPATLHGGFDRLIASHVIEHMPDPAGFLASAEALLQPEGTIALAIPDHRYCFDYFRPVSTTGEVLEAMFARRSRHPARALWDQRAYAIVMDGTTAWGQHAVAAPAFLSPFPTATDTAALFTAAPSIFEDCHAWRFTPASFALILLELGALGLCTWQMETLEGPSGCEFFAILRRRAGVPGGDPTGLAAERLRLLRARIVEQGEQAGFAAWAQEIGEAPSLQSLQTRLIAQERRLAEVERVLGRIGRRLAPFAALWRKLGPKRPD